MKSTRDFQLKERERLVMEREVRIAEREAGVVKDVERLDFLQKHLSGVQGKTDGKSPYWSSWNLTGIQKSANGCFDKVWESGFHTDIRVAVDALIAEGVKRGVGKKVENGG